MCVRDHSYACVTGVWHTDHESDLESDAVAIEPLRHPWDVSSTSSSMSHNLSCNVFRAFTSHASSLLGYTVFRAIRNHGHVMLYIFRASRHPCHVMLCLQGQSSSMSRHVMSSGPVIIHVTSCYVFGASHHPCHVTILCLQGQS